MADRPCTHSELITRVVALEAGLSAFKELMAERDERYKLRASSQDAAVKTAMDAADKALVKAEAGTERRLEALNELRSMASDQSRLLMPRAEYTVQHQSLEEKVASVEGRINQLRNDLSEMQARGGGLKDAWGYLVGVAGLVIAGVIAYFHR